MDAFYVLPFYYCGNIFDFSGIAYSDYILKNPVTFDLIVMGLMIFYLVLLYIVAKQIEVTEVRTTK